MLKVGRPIDYLKKEKISSEALEEVRHVKQIALQRKALRFKRSDDNPELPENFEVGQAIGGGDCFFDSVAKGLKQLKPNMEFSVKSLRQICKKLAIGNQQLKAKVIKDVRNSHGLTIVLPDSSIGDDELWNTYLASIEYTSEDIERMKVDNPSSYQSLTSLKYGNTLQLPIWGRPDIEGQLICNEYNVKLHIIENLLNAGWSNQIIDESSSRSIDNVDYNEANTIHIINRGTNHFEPILDTMKTVHQENQLTHDDSQSRSEQQQLESRAKRVISNFNRPRSSSQVGMLDSRQQSATDTDFDKVNRRLEEFVGYFVKEFEAKLHAYHMILEGEVKKSGKFSDTFSGKIGRGVGAAAGGLVGLLLGSPVSGAKLGAKAGEEGGKKLGSKIGDKQHKKKITNLLGLVDLSQKDKANFRRELVEAGFDVFQSFEMQFMRVTTDQGTKKAIQQLAKDATNRAINYVEKKDASITEGVIFGKSKREGVSSISPGFEIKYEYLSNKKICSTTNLYDKVGVLVTQKNKLFYHKKKSGSETGKYGYRRLLISENWEKLKEDYEPENIVESKSIQFTDYIYILDQKDLKQKVEGILREINLDDKDLEEERMKKILEEVKDDIMNEVNALKRQSHQYTEDRKILVNIEANLKNLKIDEYLRKFKQDFEEVKQGQQKIVKSIEIGQEENRENFNQLSQKQDIHHDNNIERT